MARKQLGVAVANPQDQLNLSYLDSRLGLPSYAQGLGLKGVFDPRLSSYNFIPDTMHKFRAAYKKLVSGVSDVNVVWLADSTGSDYNGTAYVAEYTIPRQFGKAFAKMVGDVSYVDGYKRAMQAGTSAVGSDIVTSGACTTAVASSYGLLTGTGAGTIQQTTRDPGTRVTVVTSNQQTNGIAWTIDGVAQTPLVADATATLRATTVTGLANKTHVVVMSPTAGQTFIWGGAFAFEASVKQFRVHNLSLGGARANSGNAGQNANDTTTTGLGNIWQKEITALGFTPDLLVVTLGNNDTNQGIAAATSLTGIHNVRNYYPTIPALLIHPPKIPGNSDLVNDALAAGHYTEADTSPYSMLFDWDHYEHRSADFVADGLAGADNTHPNDSERIGLGRHIAHILCDMTSPAERSYQINESGGVYPVRPAQAAAGMVNYTGADQPTDWVNGDTWDDLP